MFFFQFKVRPQPAHPKLAEYSGAIVNCWINLDIEARAESVARSCISDSGWRIVGIEEATFTSRDDQSAESLQYFEQAEIDGEVFVFFTVPAGAPDDEFEGS